MTEQAASQHQSERLHIRVTGDSRAELGRRRGTLLRDSLREAYDEYGVFFRAGNVSLEQERAGAQQCIEAILEWRPEVVEEFEAMAEASGLDVLEIGALNSRTEILGLATFETNECSTVAARIDGRMLGVQTWDWHVDLQSYWHTQEVMGPGYRFAGVTEQGIIGKIGVNEAGLAVHFNILRHEDDGPGGVPMHVLANVVLTECSSVTEALALIRSAKITSSSSLTLVDAEQAIAAEISPVGVFETVQDAGAVIRTNHFQHAEAAEGQKPLADTNSRDRFALVRKRLDESAPENAEEFVDVLLSGPGEAPLCRIADPSMPFGSRSQTLCTAVTDPEARTIQVLDGMPTERHDKEWRTLTV